MMLGSAVTFELPVLVFFLTLLHLVTPRFLMRNFRYVILGIALLAAVLSPSPNPLDMAIIGLPMLTLFFAGVFASYGLVRWRERAERRSDKMGRTR